MTIWEIDKAMYDIVKEKYEECQSRLDDVPKENKNERKALIIEREMYGLCNRAGLLVYTPGEREKALAFRQRVIGKILQRYTKLNEVFAQLDEEEKKGIWKNVKAMTISRLGHLLLNSSDNIIISAFVGISWVGLLSNFTLIVDAVTGVLSQITHAMSASIGNFFVQKGKKSGYELFKKVDFMNFWLYK